MIFNLSYNWLKEYLPKAPSPQELARLLSLHSVSVERLHRLGGDLAKIVVGEIVKIDPHPQADRLKVVETKVDGPKHLKIVCGGSNLFEGQKLAVALPGAKVRWHGQGEPVELKTAKIRGIESEGMICAAEEIGLGDYFPKKAENEILDLSFLKVKVGSPLVKVLPLEDTVMEAEATTNRPDLLSVAGIAREAAAILKKKMKATRLWQGHTSLKEKVAVTVEDKKLCSRYQAVAVRGVCVEASPWRLQQRLLAAGIRPINNVVDVTNYVMLELGQPLHAFDASRVKQRIVVRQARAGEKLKALDGKEYNLGPEMLVIADAEKALAIAGVMGGEKSSISAQTTAVILESANFDPVSVRRTARALNLYSESQARFERGLSPEGTTPALLRALELLQEISAAKLQISATSDSRATVRKPKVYALDTSQAEKLIGVAIPLTKIKQILSALGFIVRSSARAFKVTVPYWREMDIEGSRDLIEEIARLYGYHNLPARLPEGQIPIASRDNELQWEDRLKRDLAGFGLTEAYTYSFLSKDVLEKIGWPLEGLIRVANPLSEEFEYMRSSLIPGALSVTADNQENYPSGGIFEVSKVYASGKAGELPREEIRLLVCVWSEETSGQSFFKAKGILEALFEKYGMPYRLEPYKEGGLFHPGRSVKVFIKGASVGTLAEIHPKVLETLKIDKRAAVLELPLESFVTTAGSSVGRFEPLPVFPAVKYDLAAIVDRQTSYASVVAELKKATPLISRVELFDVYSGRGVPDGKKSLALHILYQSSERTLTDAEVGELHNKVAQRLQEKFQAVIR